MKKTVEIDLVPELLELSEARAKIGVLVERKLVVKVGNHEKGRFDRCASTALERELDLGRVRGRDVVDGYVHRHGALSSTAYASSDA
jgi:hypothetical protein